MMKKFKILSLILALTLVFASMSTVAFADLVETLIVADIAALNELAYSDASVTTKTPLSTDGERTDVLQFSSTAYTCDTTIGKENRIKFSDSTDDGLSLGVDDWTEFDSLKIETDIHIGDVDDGLGFRFKRYAAGTTEDYKESGTSLDFFVGVGGSSFGRSTVTNGYTYEVSSLTVGWNSVVIELGSSTNDVNITVNGATPSIKARKIVSGTSSPIDAELPEGTYGFCGSENKAVLTPKGKKASSNRLDVRLDNFKMSAVVDNGVVHVEHGSMSYSGTQTTGYIKYTNTKAKAQKVYLIMANYDANHNLIKAASFPIELAPNVSTLTTVRKNMNTGEGTAYTKKFIWEDVDGDIVPMTSTMTKYKN